MIEVGRNYFRKQSHMASVRKILAIEGGQVQYQNLHGPSLRNGKQEGRCTLKNFQKWSQGPVEQLEDYSFLDGAKIRQSFLVLDAAGRPLLRCSEKRANNYLRKGFVTPAGDNTLQFTNTVTEDRLHEIYGKDLSPYFLAVKNSRCVVCGYTNDRLGFSFLTRHHIIPRRCLKNLPPELRKLLSNVLFVCLRCHGKYTNQGEPGEYDGRPYTYAKAWRDHFLKTLEPKFLPQDWSLFAREDVWTAAESVL